MGKSKLIKGICIVFLTLSLVLTSCGSKFDSAQSTERSENKMEAKNDTNENKGKDEAFEQKQSVKDEVQNKHNINESKIIIRSFVEIETLKFEEDKNSILNRVDKYGGYVQSSEITGKSIRYEYEKRRAHLVLRIPKENYREFYKDIEAIGNVTSIQEDTEDITLQYYDNEARIKSLKIQEERLLELLKKADKLEDIITLERELQNVRYDIEINTSKSRKWNNLVDYCTVNVNLREVVMITETSKTPITMGEKISHAFTNSIKRIGMFFRGFVVFIVAAVPYLIIIVPIVLLVLYFYRRYSSKKSKDKSK